MPSYAAIQIEAEPRSGGTVYRLRIAHGELNLINSAALAELGRALSEVGRDAQARALVLGTASARAWIAGADLGELTTLDPATARDFIQRLHGVCRAIRELPVPVLASIQGYCLGAGLELAMCCDLRLAASDASFGMPEVQVGIPSVIEAALLPRLIGAGRARDLVLSGRILPAAQALNWGLVEAVAPVDTLEELVEARLADILCAAPGAVRAQKALCRQWEELPLAAAIDEGIEAFARAYQSDEPRRYMQRFLQRKRPERGGSGSGSV